jgi:hypothetical protein
MTAGIFDSHVLECSGQARHAGDDSGACGDNQTKGAAMCRDPECVKWLLPAVNRLVRLLHYPIVVANGRKLIGRSAAVRRIVKDRVGL